MSVIWPKGRVKKAAEAASYNWLWKLSIETKSTNMFMLVHFMNFWKKARGKHRNIIIIGPLDSRKTFML